MSESYEIHDSKGIIVSFAAEEDALNAFNSAPNDDIPEWDGDLRLVKVLAVRR